LSVDYNLCQNGIYFSQKGKFLIDGNVDDDQILVKDFCFSDH